MQLRVGHEELSLVVLVQRRASNEAIFQTGVQWLAYGEMVWITSQLSYWAAQAVTNSFSQATIILGFLFTFSQIGKKLDVKNFLKTSSYACFKD